MVHMRKNKIAPFIMTRGGIIARAQCRGRESELESVSITNLKGGKKG